MGALGDDMESSFGPVRTCGQMKCYYIVKKRTRSRRNQVQHL